MSTLYVSDLDGTLLNDEERISPSSIRLLNDMIDRGLHFTIATARSYESTRALLEGVNLKLPGVFMNGVFLMDLATGQPLESHFLANQLGREILSLYARDRLNPVVYTIDRGGRSRVYYRGVFNPSEEHYFGARLQHEGDRFRRVDDFDAILDEQLIAVNAIEVPERLEAVYAELSKREGCVCHYGPDIYAPGYHWLEVSSDLATKRQGVERLKQRLGFERLVCFGDNLNDLSMFGAADECYAVANAHEEVKRAAMGVIGRNDEDGVARFIAKSFSGR